MPLNLRRGSSPNDHANADSWYVATGKLNDYATSNDSIQSQTINAGDVKYTTNNGVPVPTFEGRIQLAINDAISQGVERVYVPAFMLPYDASLVTFSTVVQMVREGGTFDVYDVRAYGAAGDGILDDTIAIQAAVDKATVIGGIVFLPSGTFLVTASISTYRNVLFRGSGWQSILKSTTANPILKLVGGATAALSEVAGIFYSNFRIDGGARANGLTGLKLMNTVDYGGGVFATTRASCVEQLQIANCSIGLHLANVQHVGVRNCKFGGHDIGVDTNTTGVYLSDASELGVFEQCDFRGNIDGMKMEWTGTPDDGIYGWSFINCHWEGNSGKGVILDGAQYNVFLNCKWEGNLDTYLLMQNTHSHRNDGNQFIGGTFNGTPSVPTVKQVDLQSSSGTIFQGVAFNAGNTNGVNIASGGGRTMFIGCSLGSTLTDASPSTEATVHWNPISQRVTFGHDLTVLTDGGGIAVDASLNDVFHLTLTGSGHVMVTPTKPKTGQRITFIIVQDATGGRTLLWESSYKQSWSDTGNTAGKASTISFVYDRVTTLWHQDGGQSAYL